MENIKFPCIKCSPIIWTCIVPYLEEWGYNCRKLTEEEYEEKEWNLLILNWNGTFGNCGFGSINYHLRGDSSRELVESVNEFLSKAAKLKGFSYSPKSNNSEETLEEDFLL